MMKVRVMKTRMGWLMRSVALSASLVFAGAGCGSAEITDSGDKPRPYDNQYCANEYRDCMDSAQTDYVNGLIDAAQLDQESRDCWPAADACLN
jgi:hypothetical protein